MTQRTVTIAYCSSVQRCGAAQPANKVDHSCSPDSRKLLALLLAMAARAESLLTVEPQHHHKRWLARYPSIQKTVRGSLQYSLFNQSDGVDPRGWGGRMIGMCGCENDRLASAVTHRATLHSLAHRTSRTAARRKGESDVGGR